MNPLDQGIHGRYKTLSDPRHHDRRREHATLPRPASAASKGGPNPSLFDLWSQPTVSMPGPDRVILAVAVPSPLKRVFDYLPGPDTPEVGWVAGVRVRVPFGRRSVIGVVIEIRR